MTSIPIEYFKTQYSIFVIPASFRFRHSPVDILKEFVDWFVVNRADFLDQYDVIPPNNLKTNYAVYINLPVYCAFQYHANFEVKNLTNDCVLRSSQSYLGRQSTNLEKTRNKLNCLIEMSPTDLTF